MPSPTKPPEPPGETPGTPNGRAFACSFRDRRTSLGSFSQLLIGGSQNDHSHELLGSNLKTEEIEEDNMALQVEVAGFGLCQTNDPYSLFVVCVQQENFEAWTVYRNFHSFVQLREQIIVNHPDIPPLIECDVMTLNVDMLESYRIS
jgi:hypothetical protein